MTDVTNKGCLLLMTTRELFTQFAKDNKDSIADCEIIVVTRELHGTSTRYDGDDVTWVSRYDNVDFLPNLLPKLNSMEFIMSDNDNGFISAYDSRLVTDDAMEDIWCIVDMVVTSNIRVIILVDDKDMTCIYPKYLLDFIQARFGLNGYVYSELLEDNTIDPYDIGDVEQIKDMLGFYKVSIENAHEKVMYNRFTTDPISVYRDMLSQKSIEQLRDYAEKRKLRVSHRKNKEEIIEMILDTYTGGELAWTKPTY